MSLNSSLPQPLNDPLSFKLYTDFKKYSESSKSSCVDSFYCVSVLLLLTVQPNIWYLFIIFCSCFNFFFNVVHYLILYYYSEFYYMYT